MSSGNAEQLRRARRNQAFDNTPASATGQCPLKGPEVAIFPVRYALDESPPKGGGQGPNPLPADWPEEHLPPLRTRGYTLRQLRDGWLYVWDEQDRTFHEY
ncbi:toxin VasX, partial [Pseudomonas aeruginosa]